jgi:hypothetical protein
MKGRQDTMDLLILKIDILGGQMNIHEVKIEKYEGYSGTSYQITVKGLDILEISECFRTQFPNEISVIISGGQVDENKYQLSLGIIGLKLKPRHANKKCREVRRSANERRKI